MINSYCAENNIEITKELKIENTKRILNHVTGIYDIQIEDKWPIELDITNRDGKIEYMHHSIAETLNGIYFCDILNDNGFNLIRSDISDDKSNGKIKDQEILEQSFLQAAEITYGGFHGSHVQDYLKIFEKSMNQSTGKYDVKVFIKEVDNILPKHMLESLRRSNNSSKQAGISQ